MGLERSFLSRRGTKLEPQNVHLTFDPLPLSSLLVL